VAALSGPTSAAKNRICLSLHPPGQAGFFL
jgi:hypothetical protein